MKKGMLTLGAILLVLGLGLSWTGARLGGSNEATLRLFGHTWSLYAPAAGRYGGLHLAEHTEIAETTAVDEAHMYGESTSEAFSALSVDVDIGEVTVAAGDDYEVNISYWGEGYEVLQAIDGNGTMMVWSESSSRAGMNNCGAVITVYVPTGLLLEDVSVFVDLGSVTLAGLTVQNTYVEADLGDIIGEGLDLYGMTVVNASLGNVVLYGNLGESVEVNADLGDVTLGLNAPAASYCWDLNTDLGSILVDGRRKEGGSLSNTSMTGGNGDGWIYVDADLGSIQVDFDCVTGIDAMVVAEGGTAIEDWHIHKEPVSTSMPEAPSAPTAPTAPAVPEVAQWGE